MRFILSDNSPPPKGTYLRTKVEIDYFGGFLTCGIVTYFSYLFRELLLLPLTMQSLVGATRYWGQL